MNSLQNTTINTLPKDLIRLDEPMADHTSFAIGGPADVFLMPRSLQDLLLCIRTVREQKLPFFLLGGGTNLLVSDRGIRAVVISMAELSEIRVEGTRLIAKAGATVENVCRVAAEHELSGLEFINGMPGTIGGAAWMNARCYGSSISDVLVEAQLINEHAELETLVCTSDQFDYKKSPFQAGTGCIYELVLELRSGESKEILKRMHENLEDRKAKGHFAAPSAGSLFKNNREFGAPTGKIIDELGLRGTVSGGAAIASFHGNIFINQGGAAAADVLALIRMAVEKARRERNIRLEPEVLLVGEWLPEELAFLEG